MARRNFVIKGYYNTGKGELYLDLDVRKYFVEEENEAVIKAKIEGLVQLIKVTNSKQIM